MAGRGPRDLAGQVDEMMEWQGERKEERKKKRRKRRKKKETNLRGRSMLVNCGFVIQKKGGRKRRRKEKVEEGEVQWVWEVGGKKNVEINCIVQKNA